MLRGALWSHRFRKPNLIDGAGLLERTDLGSPAGLFLSPAVGHAPGLVQFAGDVQELLLAEPAAVQSPADPLHQQRVERRTDSRILQICRCSDSLAIFDRCAGRDEC
jgi:hypothetical protein